MDWVVTNLDQRNYSKAPTKFEAISQVQAAFPEPLLQPDLRCFPSWEMIHSLAFDVLCLAGVTDAVDLLTQHLFAPPSLLPPFTVEAVKALQCFPTPSPSFPGIWAEDGGGCCSVGGSPWQLWQCFWESCLLPDKWEEWSRHQTSHFFSCQIYTWPWKIQPLSGSKQILKISEWKYRRNLGSWWLGWVTIALEFVWMSWIANLPIPYFNVHMSEVSSIMLLTD